MLLLSYWAQRIKRPAKWETTTTNGRQQIPVPRAAVTYGRQLKIQFAIHISLAIFFSIHWNESLIRLPKKIKQPFRNLAKTGYQVKIIKMNIKDLSIEDIAWRNKEDISAMVLIVCTESLLPSTTLSSVKLIVKDQTVLWYGGSFHSQLNPNKAKRL